MTNQPTDTPKATALDLLQSSLIVAEREGMIKGSKRGEGLLRYVRERQHPSETVRAAKMLRIMGYTHKQIAELLNKSGTGMPVRERTVSLWLHPTNPKRCTLPEDCLSPEEIKAAQQQRL